MYIERVPSRSSPPAVLLREAYREGGKVKKRTLANLSKWPTHLIEGLRILLRGGIAVECLAESFDVVRSRPHGHVAAVLGTLRRVGLGRIIGGVGQPEHARVLALVAGRILFPRSKLALSRELGAATQTSTLAEGLGVGGG